MKTDPEFERCLSYINCEINPPPPRNAAGQRFRAVTISRQAGSGAHAVASRLAELLQETDATQGSGPWTVFDRNLIEQVLEDHHLPARLAKFMGEDRITELSDIIDELFGLHPPSLSLVRNVSETIMRLADRGGAIIIGRGANVITASMEHVLHVRLVGSVEKRVEHLRQVRSLGEKAAMQQLQDEDRGRARYLKKYFGKEVSDPLLYHLVINTDLISHQDAAELIAATVLSNARAREALKA